MGSPTDMDFGGLNIIANSVKVGATGPGQAGTDISGAELTFLDGATAANSGTSKALITGTSGAVTLVAPTVTAANGISSSVTTVKFNASPVLVQQALSGAGAVNLTTYYTAITNTGADALTLADSTVLGQLKKVKMVADPGTDSTLTFNGTATIVFADVGDYAVLVWNGSDWIPIELGNDADGSTAPVYTPAA